MSLQAQRSQVHLGSRSAASVDTHSLMLRHFSLPPSPTCRMKPGPHTHSYPLNVFWHLVLPSFLHETRALRDQTLALLKQAADACCQSSLNNQGLLPIAMSH